MSPIYIGRALSLQHVDLTFGAHRRIHRQMFLLVILMTYPQDLACPHVVPCVREPALPANLVQGVAWGCLGGERKPNRISRSFSLYSMPFFTKIWDRNLLFRHILCSATWLIQKSDRFFASSVFLVVVSDEIITNAHTCDVLSAIALIGHRPRLGRLICWGGERN